MGQTEQESALCGCEVPAGEGRKAAGVDPEHKERTQKRLRRIEGQIRGLQKMVAEDRYCPDILVQIASVHEALRGAGRSLMRNHLRHCVARAVKTGGPAAETTYDELLDLIYSATR